ncbi:apolipoprotein B-100 [Python bivittatus]|uniref:Apolipoprotein B-100 n=1 Tax=Python bivittatus TaxID=176946 RepID=A0A9F3QUS3_PYTBI|nr:apolipoprotein B-100 [Python bivittatus]
MGHPQLWLLLLLLSSEALTRDATRFKSFRKYIYNYEAEITSGVTGTADSHSGSKIKCKVELEVPQLYNLVLKISLCTLEEVYGIDIQGKALLKQSRNSDEFAAAMSQYDLKFKIQDEQNVELYPEDNEATHILNIKRGIISALLVPMETEVKVQTVSMDTVYGKCDSSIEIKDRKSNTATLADIEITRNLKSCDNFNPIRDNVSPIAFIKGLNAPLSTLLSSNQHCHYTVDTKKKHVSAAICTEKHLFLPSSYKNQYGMMAKVVQTLKYENIANINNRNMDVTGRIKRELSLENVETKILRHGDAVLKVLQELKKLTDSQQNHKRANLFYRFVTGLRSLHNSTLSPLVPKMMETSSSVTIQALIQCGTPECFGAILQILRTGNIDPLVADAVTFSMGLLPSPSTKTIREILTMAEYHPSRASFYALSHSVNRFYFQKGITEEIKDVVNFMTSLISKECSGNEDLTYLTLRAIGNMGNVLENVNPSVKQSLKACIRSNVASPDIQKAAIQALRKMTINDEDRGMLIRVFQEASSPANKRLAAYLMLMRNPSSSDISKVIKVALKDKNEQVKSFVASHIANILDSTDFYNEPIRIKIQEALKGNQMPTVKDFRRFSRNYQVSKMVTVPWSEDPFSAKLEGNLLFDPSSYIAKEAMLKTTLELFGLKPLDIFEIGLDGKNLEPTLEAMFGPGGFFPDAATKALYWVDGKVPEQFSQVLFDYFGYSKDGRQDQDIMKEIMLNFEKTVKEITNKPTPDVKAYFRIFQEELGYLKLSDLKVLGNLILKSLKTLQTIPQKIVQAISQGSQNDLMIHYIFMDNEFELPTSAGLQLQVALSGVATPGTKLGMKISQRNMQAELIVKPSMAVEFITHLGVNIPEYARNGVQMNTNIYHESGIEASVALKAGHLKLTIPAPKVPIKVFSISNVLHLVTPTRTDVIPPLIENRVSRNSCSPFFTGLKFCTRIEYSNASSTDAAPYYPLTGETRFEIELQPTGKVKEYIASANYELKKEGKDLVDTLKFIAQAKGIKESEAKMDFVYNRAKRIFTTDLEIPSLRINFGTSLRITDSSSQEKKAHSFILDIINKKSPEITITGKLGYAAGRESSMEAAISIPRLQTQAKTDVSLHRSSDAVIFQIDSSATSHGSSVSERIVLRYDTEKVEVQWNSGTSAPLKRMSASVPGDLKGYSKSLQKSANGLLDHKVANTDMTVRHIISHFIVATNTWLQKASKDIPHVQNLQDKLNKLQELDFQIMDIITIPEELFFKSDGKIKYVWNKESTSITIPVPFGGKSSQDMSMPKTIRAPPLVMESLGLNMPSQEYKIPQFTVPESYTLRVPLLGTFEIISNLYNNYYNWSGSYTLANTTRDTYNLRTSYFMKADSVLDLLSYKVQGQAEASYDRNALTCNYENSLHHSLLNSNFKFRNINKYGLNPTVKNTITFETSSPLGARFSLSVDHDSKELDNSHVGNLNLDGQLNVATAFAKTTYIQSITSDKNSLQLIWESNLKFDSSLFQATNQMIQKITEDAWTILSISNIEGYSLTNKASLSYQNSQLKLSSETHGTHTNFGTINKFDLTLDKQQAILHSELKANYLENKYYALVSGSVNNQGVELISDLSWDNERNKAEHKSALSIKQDGLVSSATTKLQLLLFILENEMNARIGTSGASVKIDTNGRAGIHNAKFSLDGKLALTEIALLSTYQGSILDVDSKNILNFRVNKGDLRFSNSLTGSYKEMKLEHTHELNTAGFSLTYASNLDHTISPDISHKHHVDLQLQPYSLTANLNNDLKYSSANVNNKARLQLEPLKVNLDGNIKGTYSGNEIKHTYIFTYGDLTAHMKTDTAASIQGAALTHKVNLNVAGLSSSINVNTNCDSKFLTFSNEIRSVAAPFTVTFDMHTNADGRFSILGEQSGRLYSKFLLKAEPLAIVFSHDYQGSTDHNLNSGKRYNTGLDSKATVVLTPSEQSSTWKMKSQLNNHVYTQDINAFNNAENIGVELTGQTLADLSVLDFPIKISFTNDERVNLIDTFGLRENIAEPQEFGLSLSVKYDKNADVHVINLPFLERLPAYYEQFRRSILTALKSIQKNLKNMNIDQLMRKYKTALDKFPQQVNDYVNSFDLESKMNKLKEKLDAFTKDYSITVDDVQDMLENAKANLLKALTQLQVFLNEIEKYMKENYDLRPAIIQLIEQIVEKIKVLDKQYEISMTMINTIQQLQSFISQYDPSQIGSNAAAWVQNMDTKYKIRAQIQEKLDQLKSQIQNLDGQHIAETLKQQIKTIDIGILIEKLKIQFPFEKINQILEQIKDIILNFMEDYAIFDKINGFRVHMHELIVNYNIDQQAKVLMDKMEELFKQQKIKETIQQLTITLRKIDIKSFFNQMLKFIDDAVKQLQTFDYKKLVDGVNDLLDTVIKKLKSFDYNKFVDETNNKIQEATQKINDEIKALELPQKAEAAKQYIKEVYMVVSHYIEKLKDNRLAAIVNWLNDLLSSPAIEELKIKMRDFLEDARKRIYQMDIPMECQRYLQKASQLYRTIISYLVDQWDITSKKISVLAEKYNIKNMADSLNQFVETGFNVPEIRLGIINIPAFEFSLRALQNATFQTPDFIIPLTDLRVPSYQINFKKLNEIRIPVRFTTPKFTILNTIKVPSYTIDFNEIKLKIVRTIDQIMTSDFQLPATDIYFQEVKIKDLYFSDFSLPEMNLPQLQIPELLIPKLNLNEFQFPDIKIPEFQLPRIPYTVTVPTFGKLSGTCRIASPFFTLTANAGFQNVTAHAHSPEFEASVSALAVSKIDYLAFTITANTHLLAPEMKKLILKESLKFTHLYFKADHGSEVVFLTTSVQGNAETTASFHTARNAIELHNKLTVNLDKMISMESKTIYTHRLNVPKAQFTSQAELSNEIKTALEAGRISVTSTGKGDWKWTAHDYSDEGTHESKVSFTIEKSVAAFVAENKINAKYLRVNQRLEYEYNLPSSSKLQVESTMESPQLGHSVLNVQGTGSLAQLKMELSIAHNAKVNGRISGTINNDVSFLVQPFEIKTSTNNKMNLKVSFPLKIVGKIEFLNNYGLVLSPSTQQVSWIAEGRFNQYRYTHSLSANNNEDRIEAIISMNGDANLEFLNIPLSFPEQSVPYFGIKTPQVQGYSLWEETGLKKLLKTPKQSFDLNLKVQYNKNKDVHSFPLPLDGVHKTLNYYIANINKHFERGRDNTLAFLTESYNQAKIKFDKYKVNPSVNQDRQIFRIPGYTIPVLNIEVSPFSTELPTFGYLLPKEMSTPRFTVPFVGFSMPSYTVVLPSLELPVLRIPQELRTLKLLNYQVSPLPNQIYIAAFGNITYDFSFKSSMITLNTNAGFFNQSDIVARLSSSSTSVIDALQYQLDGTTSITRKRGLKLATALSLKNKVIEGNHDSTISFTKKNIEASVVTAAKMTVPGLKVNFEQELKGNAKTIPIISSKINLNYDIDTNYVNAKGAVVHQAKLENIISYISADTSTNSFINGEFYKGKPFSGKLVHEANAYLNSKGIRSAFKFETSSNAEDNWNFDTKENVAIEASTDRLYAVWDHSGENYLYYYPIIGTKGNQICKVTLELASGITSAALQMQVAQPNNFFGETSVNQALSLAVNNGNQKIDWKSESQILSFFLGHDLQLANNNVQAQVDLSASLGGYMGFLRQFVLPVYDRSLWHILKLDLTTRPEEKQYLNASTNIVYTKNEDGYFFPININQLADGFTIMFPEIQPNVQNPVISTLDIPSYTIVQREFKVPERLTSTSFDISLPLLPKIQFPQFDVITKYINLEQNKIPYFELTIPKYLVTVPQFTLPKTLSLGNMNVDLNAAANKIADFDLPTITIPQQQIEIPAFKFALPAGIYFPKFGALSSSFKITSPLYSATWKTDLKNTKDAFEHSIDFTANSPLQFLEYDLDGVATYKYEDNRFTLDTQYDLAHPELSAKYKGVFIAEIDRIVSDTVSLNITSPTFTDVQMHYQGNGSRVSTLISSSSAGTLGFLISLDASILNSKIFYQTQSNLQNEVDILKSEISFKNPELIQVKTNWNEDAVIELLKVLKEKMPEMADALYYTANKYHREHTGMEISSATSKLKDILRNNIDRTYMNTLNSISELEEQLHEVTNQVTGKYEQIRKESKKLYHTAADQSSKMEYDRIRAQFFDTIMEVIVEYHKQVKHLIDSAIEFLKVTKLQVPGLPGKHTGEELYVMVTEKVAKAVDQYITRVQEYFDSLIAFVSEAEIKIPASSEIIKGSDILAEIKKFLTHVQKKVSQIFVGLQEIDFAQHLRDLKEGIQQVFQKTEELIRNLQDQNYEYLKDQTKQLFLKFLQALKSLAGDIKYLSPRIENIIQNTFSSIYEKLEDVLQSIKDLRKEYVDPSVAGWSLKYYELEEKLINWLKNLFNAILEWHTRWINDAADLMITLTDQAKEFLENQEKLTELSKIAHEKILYWSEAAKQSAAEQNKQVKAKLQETYNHFFNSYEMFISETQRLIDLTIENYTAFFQYLQKLLDWFEKVTADALRPYIAVRQGELRIDIPKPFDLSAIKPINQMPQLNDEDLQQKQISLASH